MPHRVRAKWIKMGMDPNCMKNFLHAFNVKLAQIHIQSRRNGKLAVADLVDEGLGSWQKGYYAVCEEALRCFDEPGWRDAIQNTRLWKNEWNNAPSTDKAAAYRRIAAFYRLYQSIRRNGYKTEKNNLVKVILIAGMKPVRPVLGARMSPKYYRLTGMKRCVICKYLGIRTIPGRILKIRLSQL